MLSIRLFGPPQIRVDGHGVEIPRRKSRAIVYYLAARAQPTNREHLLSMFWPDHGRVAAQQGLRTTLHGLRRALGDALVVSSDMVSFGADVDIDFRRFETQLAAPASTNQLIQALALYQGPLLEDFALPDHEEFERWQHAVREQMRVLALRGFVALALQQELQQQLSAALDTLARAHALEPLNEETQRIAMRIQYRQGDRAGAIRRFEQLREQLDQELGVPPLAETRALYDAIITDTLEVIPLEQHATPAATPRPGEPKQLPFIGRTAELARLQTIPTTKLIVVEGEPGIGKTRLVHAWLETVGGLVLTGAAYELEQNLPYRPIVEALRGFCAQQAWIRRLSLAPVWRAEIARLLPELGGAESTPKLTADESRLWEGMRQLLHALAAMTPVTLFLDDLHWADEATIALLGYLVRRSADAPIRYVVTLRTVPPRSGLATLTQTLTRAGLIERVVLQRLSSRDMHALSFQISPTYGAALGEWLEQSSEGNPYVLAELVRYVHERGWLGPHGALDFAALVHNSVVPHTLYSLIASRLAPLSLEARRVLDIAVAIGREFDFSLVAQAAELPEAALLDALDELRAATIVHPIEHQRFAFDHNLTMEVAYREVGEPRHRVMHRKVAEALVSIHHDHVDDVAGLVASHFIEGGEPQIAAPYARIAGQRAMQVAAWQEAIGFFEQALGGEPVEQPATQLALGEAYTRAGKAAQATEVLKQSLRHAEQLGEHAVARHARIQLALSLIPQGRYAEVITAVQPLLGSPDAASGEFYWGAALSLEGADLVGASEHLRRSGQQLLAHPELQNGVNTARVKFELGSIAAQQGDLEAAVDLYRSVLELEAEPADNALMWHILAYNNLAYHLHLVGDRNAKNYAETGLALARENGALDILPYLLSTNGEIVLAAGDLDDAERLFHEGLQLSEQFNMPERIAGLTANLGLIAIARKQTPLAIHHLSTALARADALGTRHLAAQVRIWLAPLLPPAERHVVLAQARALAESGGRKRLLAAVESLEHVGEHA